MLKCLAIILLTVCLLTGVFSFPVLSAAVHAEEVTVNSSGIQQVTSPEFDFSEEVTDNPSGIQQATSPGEDYPEGAKISNQVELPNTPTSQYGGRSTVTN